MRKRKLTHPVYRFCTRGAIATLISSILLLSLVSSARAAVSFRSADWAGVGSGNLTINKPTGTAQDDVMIGTIGVRPQTVTITPPTGWTLVRRINNANANANSLAVYYKVAGASEPTSYTWTISTNTGAAGGIQTFSGVDTTNPIDVENGQTTPNGLLHATPSVVTTVDNAMLVTSHTFSSATTWTPPTGMTEGFDVAGGLQATEGNYVLQATAGVTGTKTATAAADADVGNAHILALRPPGISFVRSGGTTGTSFSFDIGTAGTDRLVVVIANNESSGTSLNDPGGVTVDGNNCNKIAEADNNNGLGNHMEMWYCDEDDLGASSGLVPVTIVGGGASWGVHAHLYTGVAQSGPTDYQIDNTSVSQFEILPAAVDIPANGLLVFGAANGQSGSYNDADWDTNPTEGTDDALSPEIEMTEVTDGPHPSSAILATAYWISSTGAQTNRLFRARGNVANNRGTGIVASWDVASAATTTIGDGTSPGNKSVALGSTNNAVDAFTLATDTGTDTVTALTVTFTGTDVNDVAASGVKIYEDNGATPNEWDATDTLIDTASFSGTTASFTGLNISVNTTATQYLVTYDIAAGATASNTLQGAITAATVSNALVNNDATDATLTVSATTTIGDGTDPGNITLAPGGAITDLDAFSLLASSGTDTVTAATVTLGPAGAFNNIGQADITNASNVAQCTSITNPGSNTLSFTGCTIPVTDTVTTFKVRITPKTHGSMPPVPGANYAVTGTITSFTSTNAQVGTDTASATVTIDNLSPSNVTGASATPGDTQVTVSWSNPGDADFSNLVVLRNTATISDVPSEGSSPAIDSTIGTSVVRYISSGTSFVDTGLTNGQIYYYRIFAKDTNGNYSATGVEVSATANVPGPKIMLENTSGGYSNSGSNTLTFQHTIGCGSNRLLVVSIAVEGSATYDVTDVTYNGVSLTKGVENAVGSAYYMNTEIWYMLDAALPAAGTYDVVVTTTGDPTETNINAGAISVTGATQGLPEATAVNDDAEAGSATIQTDITTSTDGAWIFDSVGSGQPRNFTPFDGRTEFLDVMGASSGGAGTYEEKTTAGLETQRWDVDGTSNRLSHVLLAFAPAVDTVPANLTQIHYRWRNDDSGETGNNPAWWDSNYQYRQQITVTAGAADVPSGYSVSVTFDHASLVPAKSQADGDDIRMVYWNGSSWTELDRVLQEGSAWNNTSTIVWFKTQAAISAGNSENDYYLYYGYSSAVNPPANKGNIYDFWDDFDNGSLEAGWSLDAIGTVSGGAANESGTVVTISATNTGENWGTADNVYHLARSQSGDFVAESYTTGPSGSLDTWAKYGGVHLRDTTASGSKNANMSEVYSAVGATHSYRVATDGTTAETTSSNTYNYNRIIRSGGTSTGYHSNDGLTWAQVGGTITFTGGLTDPVRIGPILAGMSAVAHSVDVDWFKIRSYVDPEPTTSIGSEEPLLSGATFPAGEDAKLTGLVIKKTIRLRFEISNEGGQPSGPVTYQLQWAETAACGSGSYTAATTAASGPSDHWQIVDSSYITDGEATLNIDPGLFDEESTFVPGELKDAGNATDSITVKPCGFTEIEFAIEATEYATDGGDYCFRLYDTTNSTSLNNSVYAQVQLANGIFSYRKPITIPAANLGASCSADLDDFPVLISLTDADLASKAKADGNDIIFRALDDTICDDLAPAPCMLDHEIEEWNSSTGKLIAWVRIPKLSASVSSETTIYMYYGNPNVYQPTENPAGVWDTNYVGVWHLNETTGTHYDSTSYGNNGTPGGGVTQDAAGKISGGDDFDGNDDYVEIATTGWTTTNMTFSAWAKLDALVDHRYLFGHTTQPAYANRMQIYTSGTAPTLLGLGLGDTHAKDTGSALSDVGQPWYHIVLVKNATNYWVYLNKGVDMSGTYTGLSTLQTYADIGNDGNPFERTESWNGVIDEVRISNIPRDACWIQTSFNSQDNPGDIGSPGFYSVGAEEGTPSTAVNLLSFTAKGQVGSVLVEWETAQEIRNVGFNLYRAVNLDGPFTRLNDRLIPGLTFSVKGKAYSFMDTNAKRGTLYYYKLEDIDVSGERTIHGPISVDWDADGMPDDWEVAYGFNPLLNDADDDLDGDGLTNSEEYERETDPFNPDSDGDGIPDGQESGKVPRGEPVETRTLTQGVQILATDHSGVTLELRTENYKMEVVQVDEAVFQRLRIPDYIHGFTSEVGKPELPMKGLLLDLPYGVSATLKVEETESQTLSSHWIYPVPEKAVTGEEGSEYVAELFAMDEAAYGNNIFYPAVVAEAGETYVFRGQEKLQIRFYPFAFNPKTKELTHYTRIRVRVEYGAAQTTTRSVSRALALPVPPSPSSSAKALAWTPPSPNRIYKILVSDEGIYRMTGSWLAARGVDVAGMSLNQISLYNLGKELAIHVYDGGVPDQFDSGDYIEFYGEPLASQYRKYTKQNVYWLTDPGVPGAKRMGPPIDDDPVSAPVLTHLSTVHYEEDESYFGLAPGPDTMDRWFSINAALIYDSEVQAFSNNQIITGADWGATARIVEIIDQGWTGTVLLEDVNGYFWPGEVVTGAFDGEASVVYFRTFVPGTGYTGTPSPVPVDFTINLPGVAGLGSLSVSILGLTESGHEVEVLVNGIPVGSYTWSGITFKQVAIAGINLLDGDNIVTFKCSGSDPFDALAVDWIEITYPKIFVATNDTIKFSHDAGSAYQVSGFTTSELLAFDITSATNVRQILFPEPTDSGGSYTLDMEPQSGTGERTYLVLSTNQLKTPIEITEVLDPDLSNGANGADYILITHRDLGWDDNGQPHLWLNELVDLREDQELRVKVVDLEDIYNEFSYGIVTPQAIKDFLAHAYDNWASPAPQYVLLVGDSTYDYKDNLGSGTINYVPTYLSWTEYIGETLTDDWFARVSGNDAVPDLYIGRLPAASVGQASDMVNKITTYEDKVDNPILKTWERNVLLVADDKTADYEALFEIMSNDVASLIPEGPEGMNSPFTEYLTDYSGDAALLNTTIKEKINDEGTLIVNYSGHGRLLGWGLGCLGCNIFVNADVASLTNTNMLPFFISMTCFNGYFGYPETGPSDVSLAEVLLRSANKGAIAAFMSTGMTQPEGQRILDTSLFEAIFKQDLRTLGPAISAAKQTLLANGAEYEDVSKTFLLFGDPATGLKVPLPTVPSGVVAEVQGSSVVLSWQGATDCNGGAIAGYNVYRSITPGGPYTKVNTALITGTGFTDTSAQTGTFYYVVRSVDSDGYESAPSIELVVLAGARSAAGGSAGGAVGSIGSTGSGGVVGGGGGGCFISSMTEF